MKLEIGAGEGIRTPDALRPRSLSPLRLPFRHPGRRPHALKAWVARGFAKRGLLGGKHGREDVEVRFFASIAGRRSYHSHPDCALSMAKRGSGVTWNARAGTNVFGLGQHHSVTVESRFRNCAMRAAVYNHATNRLEEPTACRNRHMCKRSRATTTAVRGVLNQGRQNLRAVRGQAANSTCFPCSAWSGTGRYHARLKERCTERGGTSRATNPHRSTPSRADNREPCRQGPVFEVVRR